MVRRVLSLLALALLVACNGPTSREGSPSSSAPSSSAPARPVSAPSPPSSGGQLVPRPSIKLDVYRDAALSADFSADGRLVAVAEASGAAVLVLDRATFAERARIPAEKPIGPIAFSADGGALAISSQRDHTITIHDTTTGARLGGPLPGRGFVESVALSRDGSRLAVGTGGGHVVLWDAVKGSMLAESTDLGNLVSGVRFSPDDRAILAQNSALTVLDVPGLGQRYHVTNMRGAPVYLRGATRLVNGCEGTKLCVYDAADGRFLRKLLGAHPFAAASDDRAVVYLKRGEIVFQDVETGDVIRRVPGPEATSPHVLSLAADGARLAMFVSGRADALVEWDLARRAFTRSYAGVPESIADLVFADAAHLAVATAAGRTTTIDLGGRGPSAMIAHGDPRDAPAVLLRGGAVIARLFEDRAEVWDREGTAPRVKLDVPRGWSKLAAPPDGGALVAASLARLTVWDADGGTVRTRPSPFFSAVALAPRAAVIAMGVDGHVDLIDPAGAATRTLPARGAFYDALAFSPDGSRLAGWSRTGGSVTVHRVSDGASERTFSGISDMTALRFSADGRLLAVGTEKGAVMLWNASAGVLLGKNEAGEAPIAALAFSPDGRLLAAGAKDGTIALARVDSLAAALRFTPLRAGGQTCALAPDGRAECFGEGGDEALVCRVDGRTAPMERCAAKRATGLTP